MFPFETKILKPSNFLDHIITILIERVDYYEWVEAGRQWRAGVERGEALYRSERGHANAWTDGQTGNAHVGRGGGGSAVALC